MVISVFLKKRDYCTLVRLVPRLTIHDPETFLNFCGRDTFSRVKREPVTAITLAVILGLGAAGAGTGIVSVVQTNSHFNQLMAVVDKDI